LPDANVIVNPNPRRKPLGSRSLAGVGVAFYVMAAVRRRLDEGRPCGPRDPPGAADLLDLVALGNGRRRGCRSMPMNRILGPKGA